MAQVRYIVALQCHIVKERCSGFFCEDSFTRRIGAFADYSAQEPIRFLSMTCGGCCGRATLRKLSNLMKLLRKKTDIKPEEVVVHLSSCMSKESFHGPICPHLDYIKELIGRKGLCWVEGTRISDTAQQRRDEDGCWHRDAEETDEA